MQTTAAVRCDTRGDYIIIHGPPLKEALQVMNWLSGGVGTMQANQRCNLIAKTIHSEQYCKSHVDAEHVDD
jgi:hypothetical protein